MCDDGLGAFLQALPQRDLARGQNVADVGAQRGLAAEPLPDPLVALALAHVAGDALYADRAPVFINQSRVDFDGQAAAVFANDLDLVRGSVGIIGHHVGDRLTNQLQVLRSYDLTDVHLHHVLTLVVHEPLGLQIERSEPAFEITGVDHVVGVIEQLLIARFGGAARGLGALAFGDVANDPGKDAFAVRGVLAVSDFNRDFLSPLAQPLQFDARPGCAFLALLSAPPRDFAQAAQEVRHEPRQFSPNYLSGFVTEDLLYRRIDEENAAVLACGEDDIRGRLGDPAVTILDFAQGAHDPPPLADLADDAHHQDSVFGLYPPSGDLRLKLPSGAVDQNGFELFARAEVSSVSIGAGLILCVAAHDGDGLRPPRRQSIHALAEKLVAPVAEQLFGLRVDQRDPSLLICHDDRVGRELHHLLKPRPRRDQVVDQAAVLAHVARDGKHARDLVLFVVHQSERKADRNRLAVHRADLDFEVGQTAGRGNLHQLPRRGRYRVRTADDGQGAAEDRAFQTPEQRCGRRIGPGHPARTIGQKHRLGHRRNDLLEEVSRLGYLSRAALKLELCVGQLGVGALQVGEHVRPGGFAQPPDAVFAVVRLGVLGYPTRQTHVYYLQNTRTVSLYIFMCIHVFMIHDAFLFHRLRVEAAHYAQNINAGEIFLARAFFEQRGVYHRGFINSRKIAGVARRPHPFGGGADLIIGDLGFIYHQVMRDHPAPALPKPCADYFLGVEKSDRHPQLAPADIIERFQQVGVCDHRRVGHLIGPGAVALQGVRLFGDHPSQGRGGPLPLGQVDFQAAARRPDEFAIKRAAESVDPQPGERPGLHRLAIPTRRRVPGIPLLPVARGRLGQGLFVPGVPGRDRAVQRIGLDLTALPLPVIGVIDEFLDPDVDVREPAGSRLAVDDHARRRHPARAPFVDVEIIRVVTPGVLPQPGADQIDRRRAHAGVTRLGLVKEIDQVVPDAGEFLRVIEQRVDPAQNLIEQLPVGFDGDSRRDDRRRVGMFAEDQRRNLAPKTGHLQRFEIEVAAHRIHPAHQVGDRLQPVLFQAGGRRLLRPGPQRQTGAPDRGFRVIGAGVDEQVIDKLVNHLSAARQVPRDDGQRRRRRSSGHLHRHRRSYRMRAARRAADAARDVNGVGRPPVSQNRFAGAGLPGEFPALDVRVERPPVGEIDFGAQHKTPTDPRHRLDLESPDPEIAREFLQHALAVERPSTPPVRGAVERRLRLPLAQRGATIHIRINRKIFENH